MDGTGDRRGSGERMGIIDMVGVPYYVFGSSTSLPSQLAGFHAFVN